MMDDPYRDEYLQPDDQTIVPPGGATPQIWQTIAGFFRDATEGRYEPTQQDISQWGSNIDPNYLNSIRDHIYRSWAPQWLKDHPAQTPPVTPPVTPPGGGGSGGGGGTGGSGAYGQYGQSFTPPPPLDLGGKSGLTYIPEAPQFSFRPPTMEEALSDPGYQFRIGEGTRSLEQSAAYKGLLNTGGTGKDLINYGQQAASQEYGNVWNRGFSLAHAQFDPLLAEWGTLAAAGQHENDLTQQRARDDYLMHYNQYRDWINGDFARRYAMATA